MASASTTWYNLRFHPGKVLSRWVAAGVCEQVAPEVREQEKTVPVAVKEIRRKVTARRAIRLPSLNVRPLLFYPLNALHRAVDWSLFAATGLFLVLFGLQFHNSPAWDRTWLVGQLREIGDPLIATVAAWAGSEWPSSSTSYIPFGLAIAGWVAKSTFDALLLHILGLLRRRAPSPEPVRDSMALPGPEEVPGLADSEQARRILLKRYRQIEGTFRSAKRKRCAFLSIDVVGSTRMKEGERELAVTVTFQAYMEMLRDIFEQHSAWKEAWTPDGVMVCFLQLDLAVAAAQAVLRRLRKFNRTENMLRTPIAVRCGLNEGEVAIFEDSNLEQIVHRVIDVTGHMQKHAQPNTLWLSAEVHDLLGDKTGFVPTDREVDGCQVFAWSPSFTWNGRRLSPDDSTWN
ncbi:MAG: hypothetical protein HYS33_10655 [Acidobacteria bacterium]|nr:hypothetical protein [Acidobacteriota bacterium]